MSDLNTNNIGHLFKFTKDDVLSAITLSSTALISDYNTKFTEFYTKLSGDNYSLSTDYNAKIDTLNNKLSSDNNSLSSDYNEKLDALNNKLSSDNNALSSDYISRISTASSVLSADYDAKIDNAIAYTNAVSTAFKNIEMYNAIVEAKDELSSHVKESIDKALTLSGVLSFKGIKQSFEVLEQENLDKHDGDIYLVDTSVDGQKDEYIWTNNKWELIGNISFDTLKTDYALSSVVHNEILNVINQNDTDNDILSSDYNTKFGEVYTKLSSDNNSLSSDYNEKLDALNNKLSGDNNTLSSDYISRISSSSGILSADYDTKIDNAIAYTNAVSTAFKNTEMTYAIFDAKNELSSHVKESIDNVLSLSGVLKYKGIEDNETLLIQNHADSSEVGDVWLVKTSDNNNHDEYVYTALGFKLIGNISFDKLKNDYSLKSEVNSLKEELNLRNDTDNNTLSSDYISRISSSSGILSADYDTKIDNAIAYTNAVSTEFRNVTMYNAIVEAKDELSSHVKESINKALTLSGVLGFKGIKQSIEVLEQENLDNHNGDIYLVGTGVEKDEYVYVDGNWQLIGNISFDTLKTDYALSSDVDTLIDQVINQNDIDNKILSTKYDSQISFLSGEIDDINQNIDVTIEDKFTSVETKINENVNALSTDYITKISNASSVLSSDYDGKINNVSSEFEKYYTESEVDKILTGYVSKNDIKNYHIDLAFCRLNETNVETLPETIDLSGTEIIDNTYAPDGKLNGNHGTKPLSRTPNIICYTYPVDDAITNETTSGVKVPHFNSERSEEIEFWVSKKIGNSKVNALKFNEYISRSVDTDKICIHSNLSEYIHNHPYIYNNDGDSKNLHTSTTDSEIKTAMYLKYSSDEPYEYVTFIFKIRIVKFGDTCINLITLQDWFEGEELILPPSN